MRRLLGFRRGILVLLLIAAGVCQLASAQQSDCKCKIGRIVVFDFGVNVPRPTVDAEIVRWLHLFWAVREFRHPILESDKGCSGITILDAALFNAQRNGGAFKEGGEYIISPPSGPVTPLDYLFDGEITGTAEPYTVTVRLEAADSREVVKSASMPISGTLASAQAVGEALAAQFLPLQNVITEWERNKRETDTDVARADPDGKMTITPKKRTLLEGEETELAVSLKTAMAPRCPTVKSTS